MGGRAAKFGRMSNDKIMKKMHRNDFESYKKVNESHDKASLFFSCQIVVVEYF